MISGFAAKLVTHIRGAVWFLFSFYLGTVPIFAQPPNASIPGFYGDLSTLATPSVNSLPVHRNIVQGVSDIEKTAQNKLVIHQNKEKAIVDWDSFDIGSEAWTHFDQQGNTNWKALNRIYNQNPSQIFGRLTADGKVFLINRNGILFGPGSSVNVHSLVASSLNLSNENFLNDILSFASEDYLGGGATTAPGPVSNHGTIQVDTLGSVMILAPLVENSGTIHVPQGDINIGAGDEASYEETITGVGNIDENFDVNLTGTVVNFEGGEISSGGGDVRVFGGELENHHIIRSVTSVRNQGRIELRAASTVTTGEGSLIENKISESTEEVHESFQFQPGEVTIAGGRKIELNGEISAPSGNVTLTLDAEEGEEGNSRIYMGSESKIDVSGEWVEKSADEQIIEAQLNSVEMRDDYGQKSGSLQGETISFSKIYGSAIGNVEAHLDSEERTAAENATTGGIIEMNVKEGDIIIREGAKLDFSGGGIHYTAGDTETTKLKSDTDVHDINEAPQYQYYQILNEYKEANDKFGTEESFTGTFSGGVVAMKNLSPGFEEGSDAGELILSARTIVLDGELDGSVHVGAFQTEVAEYVDELGFQLTEGRRTPVAGKLTIGLSQNVFFYGYATSDQLTSEIIIQSDTSPLKDFESDSLLSDAVTQDGEYAFQTDYYDDGRPFYSTRLSAAKLSRAGLAEIDLYSNTQLIIEADAHLELTPGGTFKGQARRIVHSGILDVPSGRVELQVGGNFTSDRDDESGGLNENYISSEKIGPQRIHLSNGSLIDVSGEEIDNVRAVNTGDSVRSGRLDGGTVLLSDYANFGQGIVLEKGAGIDTSGGLQVGLDGNVSGGDGGALTMKATTVILDGDLAGHSIPGQDGGKITLYADSITLSPNNPTRLLRGLFSPSEPIPESLLGKLILRDDRLTDTGFTDISLISLGDLTVASGSVFGPSTVKQTQTTDTAWANNLLVLQDNLIGDSAVSLTAGENFYQDYFGKAHTVDETYYPLNAGVIIDDNVHITAGLGGAISIEAPSVDVAGTLKADAGTIEIKKTESTHALHLHEEARLLTAGYNQPDTSCNKTNEEISYTPFDGGSVSLEADGLLKFDGGAVIDVSAAEATQRYVYSSDGSITALPVAGHAGKVAMSFERITDNSGNLTLNGRVYAKHSDLPGISGGKLSLNQSGSVGLHLAPEELAHLVTDDIDSLRLTSKEIIFDDADYSLNLSGQLVLETSLIKVQVDDASVIEPSLIQMNAAYVTIGSSSFSFSGEPDSGRSRLRIMGAEGIELSGAIGLSGFEQAVLKSNKDIVVDEQLYTIGQKGVWMGGLATSGELSLRADRIFSTTQSTFCFQAYPHDDAGSSKITISGDPAGREDSPIYSAAGHLIFAAENIEHNGAVIAPMGSITFCGAVHESSDADGKRTYHYDPAKRVYLGDQSLTSISGEVMVPYGQLLEKDTLAWLAADRSSAGGNQSSNVVAAPAEKFVTVVADEIIAVTGSEIDAEGGGGIFSYLWEEAIEGSFNPLGQHYSDRKVVLSKATALAYGDGVFLYGSDSISGGEYIFVPAEYAFAPGAMVVEDRGAVSSLYTGESLSEEGYPLVVGYFSEVGGGSQDSDPHLFALRSAEDVLQEGYFQTRQYLSGDGGTIKMVGDTVLLEASLNVSPMEKFAAGTLALAGARVEIVNTLQGVGNNITFEDALDEDLEGLLQIAANGLLTNDEGRLIIGSEETTETLTVASDVQLRASAVTLQARERIELASGAVIDAVDDQGSVSLYVPQGNLLIHENAQVHAVEEVALDARSLTLTGDLQIDNETLAISSDAIWFVPDTFTDTPEEALVLNQSLCEALFNNEHVSLTGRTGIIFHDLIDLTASGEITIATGRIAVQSASQSAGIRIDAASIQLLNPFSAVSQQELPDIGQIVLNTKEMIIGPGEMRWEGFAGIHLNIENDLTFQGAGAFRTNGDIQITSARATTEFIQSTTEAGDTDSQVAQFLVETQGGRIELEKSETDTETHTNLSMAGSLHFKGKAIVHSGLIDVTGGTVCMTSTGTGSADGIELLSGAEIDVSGNEFSSGGTILLTSASGGITVAQGAALSVAAGDQGDAGVIGLNATLGEVVLQGHIDGTSNGGRGGAFSLDAVNIEDLSPIAQKLGQGGFDRKINIRSRLNESGDGALILPETSTLSAEQVKLVADNGDLDIQGTVTNADALEGGLIELYAGQDLYLSGKVLANMGEGGPTGTEVYLNSMSGAIFTASDSIISVSGDGSAKGGIVYFRAPRDSFTSTIGSHTTKILGQIQGATQVVAEAFELYTGISTLKSGRIGGSGSDTLYYEDIIDSAETFVDNLTWDASKMRIGNAEFAVIPGVEIQSSGDLSVQDDWKLSGVRFGVDEIPGALTIRAEGDLSVKGSLIDRPTFQINAKTSWSNQISTWGLKLAAGADMAGADPMALSTTGAPGRLSIEDEVLVYSESAPLWFASSGDTNIGTGVVDDFIRGTSLSASLMTCDKSIRGDVRGSLQITAGAIQSATGNIDLRIGGDLSLAYRRDTMGSIRTIGRAPDDYSQYWNYSDGGGILLNVSGSVTGAPNITGWGDHYRCDSPEGATYVYGAGYGSNTAVDKTVTQGIATMAGGDIMLHAGGDVFAPVGVFGTGDLSLVSGGDLDGRFLVTQGYADLMSFQNVGTHRQPIGGVSIEDIHTQIDLFDAQASVMSLGTLEIGTVINPSIASSSTNYSGLWNLEYTSTTGVRLQSIESDVVYSGDTTFTDRLARAVMPATVEIVAGRDILIQNSFYMAPSQTGQLTLIAKRDIRGDNLLYSATVASSQILMSDSDPSLIYGDQDAEQAYRRLTNPASHATVPVHTGDSIPVRVEAGRDIMNIQLYLSKQAVIEAGNDIQNIEYLAQTLSVDEQNTIYAGNDIILDSKIAKVNENGLESSGPGGFLVQAGNAIDLGASEGIRASGVLRNPFLQNGETPLVVAAGVQERLSIEAVSEAFFHLREAGKEYSDALASGDVEKAESLVSVIREAIIPELIPGEASGSGEINMVKSQITTSTNAADICVISTGEMNVGKSTLSSEEEKDTGIATISGGSIWIYTADDLNVNESRVVSFGGGDIMAWADEGNINAGRGSKTAINASPPFLKTVYDDEGNLVSSTVVFQPPSVGSGIRALTYDPDGEDGPEPMPEIGDIYMFAPEGEIDAGEAGIAGKNVILAATKVLNVQNIEVGGASVGVPETGPSTTAFGALSGAGSLSETGRMAEESAVMKSAEERFSKYVDDLAESLVPKWLAVEVIGFVEDGDDEKEKEE